MRHSIVTLSAGMALAVATIFTGCGGTESDTEVVLKPSKVEPSANNSGPASPTTNGQPATGGNNTPAQVGGFGTLKGVIKLAGGETVPQPNPLFAVGKAAADPGWCAAETPIPDQSIVVDPETRGVANVFIWLEDAPDGAKETNSTSQVEFDQVNCTFVPHALVVRTGRPILVKSSDQVKHNIRTTPLRNQGVNETLGPGQTFEMKYEDQEKVPVQVKCDIHTWMRAYHLPVEHGFAAVTNEKGEFTMPELPAGEYEFLIWRENKGFLSRGYSITVQPGDANNVTIEYGLNQLAGGAVSPSTGSVAATAR